MEREGVDKSMKLTVDIFLNGPTYFGVHKKTSYKNHMIIIRQILRKCKARKPTKCENKSDSEEEKLLRLNYPQLKSLHYWGSTFQMLLSDFAHWHCLKLIGCIRF